MPYKYKKDFTAWRKRRKKHFYRYNKKWVEEHRELVNKRSREWSRAHPEYVKERDRKRYKRIKKNPDLYKAYREQANRRGKVYRQKHPERHRERVRKWRASNIEYRKEYTRKYTKAHREHINKARKVWLKKNAEYFNKYRAEYRKKQRAKILNNPTLYNQVKKSHRDYVKTRRNEDLDYAIRLRLRARVWEAVSRQKVIKAKSTAELVGCSIQELKEHIERQFQKGMSWGNMGKWHLDHIKPCVYYDLTKPKQQKACFNYKNLQPLWGQENKSKGSFYKGKRHYKRRARGKR